MAKPMRVSFNGIGEQSELQVTAGKMSANLKKGSPVYLIRSLE
jgi:hypothetical protein